MKKILSLVALMIVAITINAQNPFFEVVNYRGAFAPAPTAPWTDGWTNWDPQNTVYPASTVTVTGNITTNTTWTSGNTYLISGLVYVKGATLTIQPGTVILGDATVANSSLVITKGAKINAVGTSTNPIVFSSSKDAGTRAIGDWGGLIILGKSTVNKVGGIGNIEGIAVSGDTEFGGGLTPDDNDNSGNLKYVRIEFGGYIFATDQEINGLTMGGVGRNTIIDFVQCSFINDDAFEWFGGTVNCSHLVAYRCLDDDFDTDNGFSGSVQFCLGVRDADISDQSASSTSEGFESDNDAAGSTNTPQTTCVFSNVTDISGFRGTVTNPYASTFKFRRGARLRRNSGIKILNSIMMDAPYGVFIDGAACRANLQTGVTVFKNNIVAGNIQAVDPTTTGYSTVKDSLFSASQFKNDSLASTSTLLVSPYDFLSPDYRPATGSLALSNVNFTDAAFNNRKIVVTSASFIRDVTYRGAFAPSPAAMWTDGWTNWDPANTVYPTSTVTVSGNITTNTTWTAANTYLLQGLVYVNAGVTLTIQPGTVILGDATISNSSLVVTKNAKLIAIGTVDSAIVFTSSKAVGSRAIGDWGGIILLGRASYNGVGGVSNIEGIAASTQTEFGGGATPNDDDNSGSLKYVRIEFGGYIFATDKEINGLTMGAVGRGTTIDYVQCSFINDDAFEWFGGTVNCSHLVAYRCLDDDFDTDNGFSGSVQFGLGVRDPLISDQSSSSTSEGFESDNDASSSTNTPQTRALFSNITDISGFRGVKNAAYLSTFKFRRGARIRRNSGLRVFNSILMDAPYGVFMDGSQVRANLQSGVTKFKNNLIAGSLYAFDTTSFSNGTSAVYAAMRDSIFGTSVGLFKNDSASTTTGVLTSPYNFTAPDYRPVIGGLGTLNAAFTDAAFTGLLAPCDDVSAPGTIGGPRNIYGCLSTTTVTFTVPTIANASSYRWTVPTNCTIVSGQGTKTLVVKFATAYTTGVISVVGQNDCGNSSVSSSATVAKSALAAPTTVTGPTNPCAYFTTPAVYTASRASNVVSFDWILPTGATLVGLDTGATIQVLFNNSFNAVRDTIKVYALSACASSAAKAVVITRAVPAAVSVLNGPLDVCPNFASTTATVSSPVTYYVTAIANVNKYAWTVPVGVTIVSSNSDSSSINVTFASTFVSGAITVKGVNACGISATAKSVTVYRRVAAAPATVAETFNGTAALVAAKTVVCGYSSAVYRIRKVTYATSYLWTMKNGAFATISHVNASGVNDTAVTVTFLAGFTKDSVQVQSVTACSISAVKITSLSSVALPPTVSAISGSLTSCIGSSVTYTATAPAPTATQSPISLFRWTKPNNTTITSATADSSSITLSFNTGYTGGAITAKGQTACGIAGTAKSITMQYLTPTPTSVTSSTGLYNACIGDVITYTAVVAAPTTTQVAAVVYRWTKPNNTVITSATADSMSINLQFNTGYTGGSVTVKGQTACGALGTAKSQALTHTGCATGTRNVFTKSDNVIKASVYPNPNNGNFMVNINTGIVSNAKATIQVIDMLGKVVANVNAENNNGLINTNINSNLNNGVYTVKYTVGNISNSIKMVVQK